jgi:hypothetical protein
MRDTTKEQEAPGTEPAEGRADMNLPGADQADMGPGTDDGRPGIDRQPPDVPDSDTPERLGQRISDGPGSGIAAGEPDLVPDVEVPSETM